jgi:hypothetical protein
MTKLNEPEQPYLVLVGEPLKIKDVFIFVMSHRYKMNSMRQAIDVCIQIFITFHIKFPTECCHIWNFIQQWFYEIKSDQTKYSSSVNSLLKLLKCCST